MTSWLLAFFALFCGGISLAQTSNTVFLLPAKPLSHVSDESHWLSPQELTTWQNQLEAWSSDDGVDIYLVILTSLYNTPSEHVMRQIADQWGNPELHGVVLYVPGSAGPHLWWNGEVIEKNNFDSRARREMIERMEKRASSQVTEKDRVFSAAQELGDTMRVINAQYKQMNAMRDKWNDTIYQNWSKGRVSRRTKIIVVALVALLSSLVVGWLAYRMTRRRKRYLFPHTSPQRRFGAAYTGGSGATTSIHS